MVYERGREKDGYEDLRPGKPRRGGDCAGGVEGSAESVRMAFGRFPHAPRARRRSEASVDVRNTER